MSGDTDRAVEAGLPFRITFDGPEEDGSWGVDVALADGQRLLTAGDSIEDALRNAVESWPDELSALASSRPAASSESTSGSRDSEAGR